MTISSGKDIIDIKSVSIESDAPNSLSVGSPRLEDGKIVVTLRYLSQSAQIARVTVSIGNSTSNITVNLTGTPDSGISTNRQNIGKNPY